jgi:hypothetical protein
MFGVSDFLSKAELVPSLLSNAREIFSGVLYDGIHKASAAFRKFVSSTDMPSLCAGGWSARKGSAAAEVIRLSVSFFLGGGFR